jgi:glycosyltransferase involved in cell wall biosynthesis
VARILHVPYFITVHGSDLNVYARRWLIAPQVRWALRGAAGVITVSDALRRKAEQITRGKLRRLECSPCAGFDPAVFYPRQAAACRASLGLPQLGRIVVFVGNMVPIKGVDVLIDAWVALAARGVVGPQDRMVLIGDGTHRAAWKERAHRAGASAPIEFPGALSQETVSGWVGAANVLCLPSHHEGMPNVIVESLASGVPGVASRVGGLPELVKEGTNGLLVPPGAPSLLADALADALAREWDQGKIAESVAHLTWDAIASRNLEFLEGR